MENPVPYPVYEIQEEEESVSVSSIVFTVLHRYRQILAVGILCAVLLGAAMGLRTVMDGSAAEDAKAAYDAAMNEYEEKQKKHEAEERQYELDIASNERAQKNTESALKHAQEYAEDSVLNRMDPYNVWTEQISLYIKTNYKIMPDAVYQNPDNTSAVLQAYMSMLLNGDTFKETAEALKIEPRFLKELIQVTPVVNNSSYIGLLNNYTGLLTISVGAPDQATAASILDELLSHLSEIHDTVSATIGEHSLQTVSRTSDCIISNELLNYQQSNVDSLVSLQSQIQTLQDTREQIEENHTTAEKEWEKVSEPVLQSTKISSVAVKFGLVGFVLGVFLAALFFAFRFLLERNVYSAKELHAICRLSILGVLASEKSKQAKRLDAFLNRMEKRPTGQKDAEMLCLTAETISNRAPEAEKILVTGDLPAAQLTALAAALQATEALRQKTVVAAESILCSAATVPQVASSDVIILAADCTCSFYDAIKDQNDQIEHLGKSVLGCIVFE